MSSGNRIKERREELNMTAADLARIVGVDKATIGRWEKNEIDKIPYIAFLRILIALETTPEQILLGEEKELAEKAAKLYDEKYFNTLSNMKRAVAVRLAQMSEDELGVIDTVAQGLLSKNRESEVHQQ